MLRSPRTLMTRLTSGTTAFALTLSLGLSQAAASPPDELPEARVVGVMPVLMASSGAGWVEMSALMAMSGPRAPEHGPALAGVATGEGLGGDGGFGFAGKATEADVNLLKYGFALGLLPARMAADRTDEARSSAQRLVAASDLLAPLAEPARKAIMTALQSAQNGQIDGQAFTDALRAANEGMQGDSPRAHGYMMTGLWAGLAVYAAIQNTAGADFVAMAHPIATLLEEDAEFGGADRTVARLVRQMALELAKDRTDIEALVALGRGFYEVSPDQR